MSSIFSTQNRHTFLRRKYCFLVASALSPPVGRIEPLMGRPPRCSAMLFAHLLAGRNRDWSCYCWRRCCYRSARHGSAWPGRWLGRARHGVFQRHARSGWWRRLARRAFLAFLLALLDLLQFFVDADTLEFHHQVRHAQAPLHLQHGFRLSGELQQHVEALVLLLNAIGQLAYAPFVGFVDVASMGGD